MKVIYKVGDAMYELILSGSCSYDVLRAALRHSKADREVKEGYHFRIMGIPLFCAYPPLKKITGKKRKGLDLAISQGKLYAGNRECLYTFKVE